MSMNREERRRKRQADTRHATVVVVVFVLIVAAVITGAAFALFKFLPDIKPKSKPGVESTQQTEDQQNPSEDGAGEDAAAPQTPALDPYTEQAAQIVSGMKLEDKIAQMFVLTTQGLTGYNNVTAAGDTTKECYNQRPVGGIIYMEENLLGAEQTTEMLTNMQKIAEERTGLPLFLSVDEEGGTVTRIAKNEAFGVLNVGNMSDIGASGDAAKAYDAGAAIGDYLKKLGFNVVYAPVADVLTNPDNTAIGSRSFGSDPAVVSEMVKSELDGLKSKGIFGVVKHFPGHGGTTGDSHEGAVKLEKSIEELTSQELVPFEKAVGAGVSFVMAGHISVPSVVGDDTPASLSQRMITGVLREQLGYQGIVITDALNMKAVTGTYTADQAAVMAVNAGADLLLMPQDYQTAYNAVLKAVQDGTITEYRINESVLRIVKVKLQMKEMQ